MQLCQSIADITKRLCREDIPSPFLQHLIACRLIPLKKDPSGVRPIGVGEVLRRLMAKAVAKVLKNDILRSTGSLQTCAGLEGGIEAAVHAMSKSLPVSTCISHHHAVFHVFQSPTISQDSHEQKYYQFYDYSSRNVGKFVDALNKELTYELIRENNIMGPTFNLEPSY